MKKCGIFIFKLDIFYVGFMTLGVTYITDFNMATGSQCSHFEVGDSAIYFSSLFLADLALEFAHLLATLGHTPHVKVNRVE